MTIKRMQQRHDTAANWTTNNPVMYPGEIGFETDTGKFKFGDGTTAWTSLPYAPTAATITAAVNAVIDAAPGALDTLNELAAALGDDANFATTVTNNLAGKVAKADQLLNILDYGVSRGTASTQTAAVKTALDANSGKAFYFPPGDYRLDTQLNVTANNSIILAPGARIYAGADMSILINWDTGASLAEDKCLSGYGILDGNLHASTVLKINNVLRFSLDHLTIRDGIHRGLVPGSIGAELTVHDIRIYNTGTTNVSDNIGIEVNMSDCRFSNIVMRDVTVGVWDKGANYWFDTHMWIGQTTARYPGSVGFLLDVSRTLMVACYADTYQYGFRTTGDYVRARIIAPQIFCNQGIVSSGLAAANPGYVLDLQATKSEIYVTEGEFQGHNVTKHQFLTSGSVTKDLVSHTNSTPTDYGPVLGYDDYPIKSTDVRPPAASYDSFTAADGSALDAAKWTITTGGAGAAAITTDANRAKITTGATGGYAAADKAFMTSTLPAASMVDVEILFRHTFGAIANESYTRYAIRSTNADPQTGNAYILLLTNSSPVLTKTVSGSNTDLYNGPTFASLGLAAPTNGAAKWFRFRVKGTTLSFKVWDDGTLEPVPWTFTTTDTSVTAGGKVTVAMQGGSAAVSGISYVDEFQIFGATTAAGGSGTLSIINEYNSASAAVSLTAQALPTVAGKTLIGLRHSIIGPGASGGSGKRGAGGATRGGGGGGGGSAAVIDRWIPASLLTGTWDLNLPQSGAGGAAVTADDTNGNAGTAITGVASFSCPSGTVLSRVAAPTAGAGGTATGGTAGAASSYGPIPGGVGGLGGGAGGATTTGGAGGGAGGGGITASTPGVPSVGLSGGTNSAAGVGTAGGGGSVDSTAPTSGAAAKANIPGGGAGAGASSVTAAAQAGADATGYGAGGAGGGASLNGFNSGAGSKGGPGYVRLEWVFQ